MNKRGKCPICGKPAVPEHKPFCSRGCKDRDLIAWLDGSYALPAEPDHSGLDSDGEARL